jgi:hypothetical protein
MAGLFDFLSDPNSTLAFSGSAGSSGITPNFTGAPPPDQPIQTQNIMGAGNELAAPPSPGALLQGPPAAGDYKPPGFLDRLGTPDARGRTFGDKLFAAGAIAQGQDPSGFLENLRAQADKMNKETQAKTLAAQSLDAMRNAMGPDGKFDFQAYLKALPAGADPMEGLKARSELRDKLDVMSGPRGKLTSVNPYTGASSVIDKGDPAQPEMFSFGPDGKPVVNPVFIAGVLAKAKAEREGKPLAPKVGRAGGKAKSWGENEVNWGGGG